MSQRPIVPPPGYSFTLFSQQHPEDQQPGDRLDSEYAQQATTDQEIIDWIAGVLSDDGSLKNDTVDVDQLTDDVLQLINTGWNPRGTWTPTTAYAVGDFVNVESNNNSGYVAVESHTSGADFSDDFNLGYWVLVLPLTDTNRHSIKIDGVVYPDRLTLAFDTSFTGADDGADNETQVGLDFGTSTGQVAEGNHLHPGVYAPVDHTHPIFDANNPGFVPAAGMDTNKFLRSDGTFADFRGTGGLPVGSVIPWSGAEADIPTGWYLCNGQALNRAAVSELCAIYDSANFPYGAGDGSTTFNVPDLQGRAAQGIGQGNTAEGGGLGTSWALGSKAGAEQHTLTELEMPSHKHQYTRTVGKAAGSAGGTTENVDPLSDDTGPTGGDQPHNILGPRISLTYIVKGHSDAAGTTEQLGEINTGLNIGEEGLGWFYQKTGSVLEFRNIFSSDGTITITDEDTYYDLSANIAGQGEVNTGANVGAGAGLPFKDKVLEVLNFRTLTSADGSVTIVTGPDEIDLQAAFKGSYNESTDDTNTSTGQPQLRFIGSGDATVQVEDDPTNNRTNITINATPGVGGGAVGEGTPFVIGDLVQVQDDDPAFIQSTGKQIANVAFKNESNTFTLQQFLDIDASVGGQNALLQVTDTSFTEDATFSVWGATASLSLRGTTSWHQWRQLGQLTLQRFNTGTGTVLDDDVLEVYDDAGLVLSSAAGDSLGEGTLNAKGLYKDGVEPLYNVVEDLTPQLGGDLETMGFEVLLTNNAGTIRGALDGNEAEAAASLYYTDTARDRIDGDGAFIVRPGLAEIDGIVNARSLRHSNNGGRQVYVAEDGALYGVDPATAWQDNDTDPTLHVGGTGASQGPWLRVAAMEVTAQADIEVGERIDYSATAWAVNVTGNRSGQFEFGIGISGAEPTQGLGPIGIAPGFAGNVSSAGFVIAGTPLPTGTTFWLYTRIVSGDNAQFGINLDGTTSPTELTVSSPASGGAPGGSGIQKGTPFVTGDLLAVQDTANDGTAQSVGISASDLVTSGATFAFNTSQTYAIPGTLSDGDKIEFYVDEDASGGGEVIEVVGATHRVSAGTCSTTVRVNGAPITGLSGLNTTDSAQKATGTPTRPGGPTIPVDITIASASGASDLSVTVFLRHTVTLS